MPKTHPHNRPPRRFNAALRHALEQTMDEADLPDRLEKPRKPMPRSSKKTDLRRK